RKSRKMWNVSVGGPTNDWLGSSSTSSLMVTATPSDQPVRPVTAGGTKGDQNRVALLLILAFAATLRLFHLTAPFTDWHAWRQLDTVAMARNFDERSFWPFDPEVNWGGPNGYIEAECPLIPALIAVVYRIAGPHEIAG